MSNYTQTTAFTPKDSLVSGNPAKIIKGSEFDAEFAAIAAAVNSKSDISTTTSELALKVTGPASTTDNTIARYDGTTGKLIQSSSATLDDAGNATFSGNVLGYMVSAAAGMYGVANGFYQGYGLYNDAGNWKNTESGSGGWLWRKDDNTLSLLQGSTTGTAGTVVVPVTRLGFDAAGNATFSGNVTVGGGTLGYGAGSGGTVTQATSKSTAVTLNKPSGQITMHNAALAAGASVAFTVNNTVIAETDSVNLSLRWNVDPANYRLELAAVGVGAFQIRVTNISGAVQSEALQIQFNFIKGSTT